MKEDLFSIGKFTIHSYGLCIALGIIVAYVIAELRTKKHKLNVDTCFDLAMWAAIGGILGAKIMYYIVEIKSIIKDPSLLLDITNGFVVYGGIIGGSIACLIYCKVKKQDTLMWFDLIIPQIAIAQAFGRVGCLMSGCCYGAETDSAFHIVFENSRFAPNHIWLYPTQIMSAVGNLLNFLVLVFIIYRIFKNKPGVTTSFFLIFYSVGRYIIELFRGDEERGSVGIFSTSQFISFFIFTIGVVLFIIFVRKPQRDPVAETLAREEAAKAEMKPAEEVAEESAEEPSAEAEVEEETVAETEETDNVEKTDEQ